MSDQNDYVDGAEGGYGYEGSGVDDGYGYEGNGAEDEYHEQEAWPWVETVGAEGESFFTNAITGELSWNPWDEAQLAGEAYDSAETWNENPDNYAQEQEYDEQYYEGGEAGEYNGGYQDEDFNETGDTTGYDNEYDAYYAAAPSEVEQFYEGEAAVVPWPWQEVYDEGTGAVYYQNGETGEASWSLDDAQALSGGAQQEEQGEYGYGGHGDATSASFEVAGGYWDAQGNWVPEQQDALLLEEGDAAAAGGGSSSSSCAVAESTAWGADAAMAKAAPSRVDYCAYAAPPAVTSARIFTLFIKKKKCLLACFLKC